MRPVSIARMLDAVRLCRQRATPNGMGMRRPELDLHDHHMAAAEAILATLQHAPDLVESIRERARKGMAR